MVLSNGEMSDSKLVILTWGSQNWVPKSLFLNLGSRFLSETVIPKIGVPEIGVPVSSKTGFPNWCSRFLNELPEFWGFPLPRNYPGAALVAVW